jgi:hypothetical protein
VPLFARAQAVVTGFRTVEAATVGAEAEAKATGAEAAGARVLAIRAFATATRIITNVRSALTGAQIERTEEKRSEIHEYQRDWSIGRF